MSIITIGIDLAKSRTQQPGRQTGPLQPLGQKPAGASRLLESGGRHRRQERPAGMGGAEIWGRLPAQSG